MIAIFENITAFSRIVAALNNLVHRPVSKQIAALCYRNVKGGPRILLITSRGTGRWILPKGWPLENGTLWKTAKQEAFEEAGIVGKPSRQPVGSFRSYKDLSNGTRLATEVVVFPVKFVAQKKSFPEAGQRQMKWLSLEDAAQTCGDKTLANFLRQQSTKAILEGK
jgi:8-oxo-dGTP pyrophosphatase MutT (NUDIX family)